MNISVVDDAIAAILAHPENHNQGAWGRRTYCGTRMCVAGHIVTQAGYVLEFGTDGRADICHHPVTGHRLMIDHAATDLAGLDYRQADLLFYASGDAETIAALWKDMKEEAQAGLE